MSFIRREFLVRSFCVNSCEIASEIIIRKTAINCKKNSNKLENIKLDEVASIKLKWKNKIYVDESIEHLRIKSGLNSSANFYVFFNSLRNSQTEFFF